MKKIVALGIVVLPALLAGTASAAGGMATGDAGETQANIMMGCMLAVAIAGISSAFGLALAGSSAVAVTAEKPDMFGRVLVLQVLPMTQSVYGLLTAVLLMMGTGLLGGAAKVDLTNTALGMAGIAIGLVVGLTGISAVGQGMVAASSISAAGRNPDVTARGIIFTAMPETIAIFGLLVAILLMSGLGLL
ncbi:MAG: V-type ATP synthase subunit K [Thermoplasmata archaeon]|nr:V-type ATP synthase subunit K [Thermoplasmata archaeon]